MPTFLFGLPLHPLVVHAVVVLVPLAVLGAVVVAAWPAARVRWGWPVAVVSALAVISVPVATSTGEGLEHNLPRTPAITTHAHLGDELLVFVAAMFVFLLALLLVGRARQRATAAAQADGPGTMAAPRTNTGLRVVSAVLAALTVVFAVISAVQVVRIGDSGARAAWGDVHYVQQTRPADIAPIGD